jgi:hypothetical protein
MGISGSMHSWSRLPYVMSPAASSIAYLTDKQDSSTVPAPLSAALAWKELASGIGRSLLSARSRREEKNGSTISNFDRLIQHIYGQRNEGIGTIEGVFGAQAGQRLD